MFVRLLALFILVPLAELALFIKLGGAIGLPATLATVVVTGFLGAGLTRLQGLRTLARFQEAMAQGRLPHEELLDGIMILLAGAVLLTPGFLTDAAGFLLLVPAIRGAVRRRLARYLTAHIQVVGAPPGSPFAPNGSEPGPGPAPGTGTVIDAETEIIDGDHPRPHHRNR